MSVNIPGLRALLDKPFRKNKLTELLEEQEPDILLLQEHKLQESHLETDLIRSFVEYDLKDYSCYWTFSNAKKGYSGVASFVKQSFLKEHPVKSIAYKMVNKLEKKTHKMIKTLKPKATDYKNVAETLCYIQTNLSKHLAMPRKSKFEFSTAKCSNVFILLACEVWLLLTNV